MHKTASVLINARTQSTRVPNKLLRPFAGTSLLEIALERLNRLDFFEKRYLAVAEPELAKLADKYPNVEVLWRDQSAVQKGVNPLQVTFAHYLKVPTDYVFVMNPCLPCLTIETLRKAYDHFQATDHNSYTSVIKTGDWIFDSEGRALTNSDPRNATTNKNQTFWKGAHAFHIHRKAFFQESGLLWTFAPNDPHLIPIPEEEAVDVDTPHEFELAERYYLGLQGKGDADLILFVNFHHVRERNPDRFARLPHAPVEGFSRQIETLARIFDFPTHDELDTLLTEKRDPKGGGRYCFLTFDDNLLDHHAYAAPAMERHGIRGMFNVNTKPWSEHKLLNVHKLHLLAASLGYEAIFPDVLRICERDGSPHRFEDLDPAKGRSQYRYDTPEVASMKYFLNAVLPPEYRARVVTEVFEKHLGDEQPFAAEHYMSPEQVRDLRSRGHEIGLHGHSHFHLGTLEDGDRESELTTNRRILCELLDVPALRWVSYPYGGPTSYNDSVVRDAQANGCRFGLTMRRGTNTLSPELDVMRLARVDTNDAPGGRSPIDLGLA